MSTQHTSLHEQVREIWKVRKAEHHGLDVIKKDDPAWLRSLAMDRVELRKVQIKQNINHRLNTIASKIQKVKEDEISISKKQKDALDMLLGALNAVSFSMVDLMQNTTSLDKTQAKLEDATHILDKIYRKIMKSQLWGIKKLLQDIYLNKLDINVKDFKAKIDLATSKAHSSKAPQKTFGLQFIEFTRLTISTKKPHRLLSQQINKQEALLTKLIDTRSSYWQRNDSLIHFISLLTKDNLSRFIKNKTEALTQAKNLNSAKATKALMHSYGFKDEANPQDVIWLTKALFEGPQGNVIKMNLKKFSANYILLKGLVEMAALTSLAERKQHLEKIISEVGNNYWEVFLTEHSRFTQRSLLENESNILIWDLRDALTKEKHPIFASLNTDINALYIPHQKTSRLKRDRKGTFSTWVQSSSTFFGVSQPKTKAAAAAVKHHMNNILQQDLNETNAIVRLP